MATAMAACRLAVRLARHSGGNSAHAARAFSTSSAHLAATSFTMPALSPTMTEGNIAAWQVKEGGNFSAGDVLLEIETDKATMDVEAQEDGVLVKITQGDGAKSVQVGTRIAVLAEPEDDLSKLKLPPDEAPEPRAAAQPESAYDPPAEQASATSGSKQSAPGARSAKSEKTHKQKYPLLPSVGQLVRQNGLDKSAVSRIIPTGPNGRLLKGDVLAYLGAIRTESPAAVSSLFAARSRLDLSDIKPAAKPTGKKTPNAVGKPEAPARPRTELFRFAVSLDGVAQHRERSSTELGYSEPISEYIAAAARKANANLPPQSIPSTDDLFDQVLGLKSDRVGSYHPTILRQGDDRLGNQNWPGTPTAPAVSKSPAASEDIIDILTGQETRGERDVRAARPLATRGDVESKRENLFGIVIPPEEAARASVFAKRFKVILEQGPW